MILNSGNLQPDSRHLRLWFHTIHEAIPKNKKVMKHVTGREMLADALTMALQGVKLRELVQEIRLRNDHGQD
jgi:hypothetical protein